MTLTPPPPLSLYPMRFLPPLASYDGGFVQTPPCHIPVYRYTKENVRVKASAKPVQHHDKADTSRGGDFHLGVDMSYELYKTKSETYQVIEKKTRTMKKQLNGGK